MCALLVSSCRGVCRGLGWCGWFAVMSCAFVSLLRLECLAGLPSVLCLGFALFVRLSSLCSVGRPAPQTAAVRINKFTTFLTHKNSKFCAYFAV